MAKSSSQDLWQIITGHSALRDPDLIEAEIKACSDQLSEGLAYYKEPSSASETELKKSPEVKGKTLDFVLAISKHLHLDQLQSLSLFQSFLLDAYCGSLGELRSKLASERERRRLLVQVEEYYCSERLYILRCLKYLLGYWQDPSHPYREVYAACWEEINKDETTFIKGVWKQYEDCATAEVPPRIQSSQDDVRWLLQNLREQCELLEIILLYYKDYIHLAPDLLSAARLFQTLGFGLHHRSRVGLVTGLETLVNHISQLCSLIMVEALELNWVYQCVDTPDQLSEHHLLQDAVSSSFKELENLVLEWGEIPCQAPVLLGWGLFKHVAHPRTDIEETRLLGNKALQGDVFGYLLSILQSPYFSGERPVAGVCKGIVHSLLSLVVTAFSEESLGESQTLVAIAAKTLTHPPLMLEFWKEGTAGGVGLLLTSALNRFPMELGPMLDFLLPLAGNRFSSSNVYQLLSAVPCYTEPFSSHTLGPLVDLGEEEGSWVLTHTRTLFEKESRWFALPVLTLPAGTRGVVVEVGGTQAICWESSYSAWELFAFETASILHRPGVGVDPSPDPVVSRVTLIATLVTEILQHDWSLAHNLQPITSQYFAIIQKFSPLPHPPSLLLAACLQCVAVMAENDSEETWRQLRRTGFLPYLKSSSFTEVQNINVAPGHYGQILNVWECPRGVYPVSMATLDFLLKGTLPSNSLATNDNLACVVFVMREMFAGFHKWRYKRSGDREEIGYKLLKLCHSILSLSDKEEHSNLRLFVSHFLLHSAGDQAVLTTLALGVDTVNKIHSNSHSTSQPPLLVESLKLAFAVIDLLLQSKKDAAPTPLEHALATQSMKRNGDGVPVSSPVHLIAVIASYIHHHGDSRVPAGATRLLRRLSQVAPMSVFACLGPDAISVRDAYVNRLGANAEDTDLKVATLELITESVNSQPGLTELFLSVKAADKTEKGKVVYVLESGSCLHPVLDLINPDKQGPHCPPPLLHAAVTLLHALWHSRHDAALIALRSQQDFWKHLTNPLFNDLLLDEIVNEEHTEDVVCEVLVSSHVMHIVAMETYYVVQNQMDKELVDVLAEFASGNRYKIWAECLKSLSPPPGMAESPSAVSPRLLDAQRQLTQAWRTLLLVGSSCQPSMFGLSSSTTRAAILEDTLHALESQLSSSSMQGVIPIATELSMLYMILFKKWSRDIKLGESTVNQFNAVLQYACRFDPLEVAPLHTHSFSTLLLHLRAVRTNKDHLEPRFILGMVPYIAGVMENHHISRVQELKTKPELTAFYLLGEMVQTLPHSDIWLPTLRQYSIITMAVRTLDECLRVKSEEELVEAILSFFLVLSRDSQGGEALLVNGVSQVLCISMANALATKLRPPLQEKQTNTSGVLKTQSPSVEWQRVWHLTLRLAASLVSSVGHRFIPQALDFVGVYQERFIKALDILEVIHDLQQLEEARSTCQFIQLLANYKQQWRFTLPTLHDTLIEKVVYLSGSVVAVLSKRATLKHIVKTMHTLGVLPAECGPSLVQRGNVRMTNLSESSDSWVTSSPAFSELQEGLVSLLTASLATLMNYTPSLEAMLNERVPDLSEYPQLFALSLTPPTVDYSMPPSLGTLTTCLSTGLALMNKLDPHRVGAPSRSPGKSPMPPRTLASAQKRTEYLCLLEHAVVLLLSQATHYLADPSVDVHDKQVLKKELASELGNFSQGLLLNFNRKGAPSPGGTSLRTTTPGSTSALFPDSSSGRASSLIFSDTAEQGIFRLADSFAKQFFR